MRLHPGEVGATGWRVEPLADVVARLRAGAPGGRPLLVAVDGRGGAGKTVLVERLRTFVPGSGVVHTDDVAWFQARFDWGALLAEHVLAPLHRGGAVAFRPPAWVARGRPGRIEVPAGAPVVWVEGSGVIRAELARWFDASLYVQGDVDEQDRRMLARDGSGHRPEIDAWMAEELPLLLRERPWSRATLVVDGTGGIDHDPATEVVVADPVSAGDEVLAAARDRAAALVAGDEDGLRALLHPRFGWTSHRGARFDRDAYLAANRRNRWSGQELRAPEVDVVGDAAVLRCTVVDTVDVGGGPATFVMPMTQTWVRTDEGWRCLAGHAGPRLADG